MKNLFISLLSFIGTVQAQTIIQTTKPFHPCQENTCRNETTVEISSPDQVSSFYFLHNQMGTGLFSQDSLHAFAVKEFGLDNNSTQFDIVYAYVMINAAYGIQNNWFAGENFNNHATLPMHAYWSFGSTLCAEHNGRVPYNANYTCSKLGLHPIKTQRVSLNNHEVFRYYDNQHQKWVWVDADPGPGFQVAFISDGKGFYASLQEVLDNPELIFDEATVVVNATKHQMSENCVKENFYYAVTELDLLTGLSYHPHRSSLYPKDMVNAEFKLPKGATLTFKDRTGDLFFFQPEGLKEEIDQVCGKSFQYAMEPDSGCGSDVFVECVMQAIGNMHGMPDLRGEFIPFLQSGQYKNFLLGEPYYTRRFIYGGETATLVIPPGAYNNKTLKLPLIVHEMYTQNPDATYFFNNRILNDTLRVEKYFRHKENVDSLILLDSRNLITETIDSVYVPEEAGLLVVEVYFNYGSFPFMHEAQKILVNSGNLSILQDFLYEEGDTSFIRNDEILENSISVFPNPTSKNFHLSKAVVKDVKIYSSSYQVVHIIKKGETRFALGGEPPGIYLIPEIGGKLVKL